MATCPVLQDVAPVSSDEEQDSDEKETAKLDRGRTTLRPGSSPKHTPRMRKKVKERDDTPQPPPKEEEMVRAKSMSYR